MRRAPRGPGASTERGTPVMKFATTIMCSAQIGAWLLIGALALLMAR
ncbi:hypothetical protein [Microtetraspora fusca]|uniref:Uncharacterized protein n=1 Tax=Microtetraspora fusca TaxID=1997 RepID=A0ABW6V785_MICFU|nr:hypothetical protein [Microtetraspora fusca]